MGDDLLDLQLQRSFLHPEVRLARVEILDLLCVKLGMACTRQSYRIMQRLVWTFGQKLVTPKTTFWSTDSMYTCSTSENACRRRDIFLLSGTERVPVTRPDGNIVMAPTALCCQSVCFLRVSNLKSLEPAGHRHVTGMLGQILNMSGHTHNASGHVHCYIRVHDKNVRTHSLNVIRTVDTLQQDMCFSC